MVTDEDLRLATDDLGRVERGGSQEAIDNLQHAASDTSSECCPCIDWTAFIWRWRAAVCYDTTVYCFDILIYI